MQKLEFDDIQGIIRSAYGHLPCAAYLMARIGNAAAAREWLARMATRVTTAGGKDPVSSLNLAFTAEGLNALGLDGDTLANFAFPFTEGMTPPYRARILGDAGDNHPSQWVWGGPNTAPVHLMLMVFGKDQETLNELAGEMEADIAGAGIELVVRLEAGRQPDQREHFGFLDGVGQPVIEGSGKLERQRRRTRHATEIKAGEFLLGYDNEYDLPAESPSAARDPDGLLPKKSNGAPDLGRNGTYIVFRHIEQHVARFWNYLDRQTQRDGASDPAARESLGAKFVGRWTSGAPLVLSPDRDDPSLAMRNDFEYRNEDPHGLKCPIGSHIRRANPRDSLGSDPAEAIKSVRRHRMLRRGRSYGPRAADPFQDDGVPRGLFFIACAADLERQFEFVQQTWINAPSFAGLHGEVDPVIGNQADDMTVPEEPLRRRYCGLEAFVTTRGGAYFFLPGMRALQYLSRLPG